MNSDTQSINTSKLNEKLIKGSNTQINRRNNSDNQVTNTRQVFDNLNQSIQRKQTPYFSSTSHISSSSTKHTNATADTYQAYKLVDSKQVLEPFHQFDKKTFLFDTYARIVANNNRRYPKRLRQLAKLKRQARSNQNDYAANFDLNYGHKTYRVEDKRNLKELQKK